MWHFRYIYWRQLMLTPSALAVDTNNAFGCSQSETPLFVKKSNSFLLIGTMQRLQIHSYAQPNDHQWTYSMTHVRKSRLKLIFVSSKCQQVIIAFHGSMANTIQFRLWYTIHDNPTVHTPDTQITSLETKIYKHFVVENHFHRLVNTIVFLYFCCS